VLRERAALREYCEEAKGSLVGGLAACRFTRAACEAFGTCLGAQARPHSQRVLHQNNAYVRCASAAWRVCHHSASPVRCGVSKCGVEVGRVDGPERPVAVPLSAAPLWRL